MNDEETNTIPSKEGNIYDETRSNCTNGAYIIWDYELWGPVVKNMSEHKTKCELYFKTGYKESILNGTDSVLKDELIPVTIESDGTVKKADIGSEWYSYEKKNWANAVILFDESKDYLAGEVIPESEIESYFVWIPKYRYQLWDLGQYDSLTSVDESKVHEIPILFGDYDTSDSKDGECTTPMESGSSGNCAVGDYMTHPAFLSIPSTGFWVGKFETGYQGATSTTDAEQNVNDSSKVIIKPNVYSWRNINLANIHLTSYNYQRDLDSHAIKNTEWGAVAYLQHSAYGSATSVRINNYSSHITGYQANEEPTCGWTGTNLDCNKYCDDGSCNTAYPNSTLASTTGNISGIYDMSGGAHEYVMGAMTDNDGNVLTGRDSQSYSEFKGALRDGEVITTGYDWPEETYYDKYVYNTSDKNYQARILGDFTGEAGPFFIVTPPGSVNRNSSSWYNDDGWFITNENPLFVRSYEARFGNSTGMFIFLGASGVEASVTSFRIVLTPTGGTI